MLKHHVVSLLKKVTRFNEAGKRDFIAAVEHAPGVFISKEPAIKASLMTAQHALPFAIAAMLTNTSPTTVGDQILNVVVNGVFLTIPYVRMLDSVERFETWKVLADTSKRRLLDWHKVLAAANQTGIKAFMTLSIAAALAMANGYISGNFSNGLLWSTAFFFGMAIPCNLIGQLTTYRTKYLMYMTESIEADLKKH
ncbi:hypothetical protein [Solibacillus sp. NPDC093137]|uniref:hypothetical protein n=1 Tax=Solibacillus sp. NPDC093137 TaxID=3390678 RepID=UPI003D088D5D